MKVTFSRVIVAILALAAPAIAETADLPTEGLEGRVEFWKKVFTQYGENDVIIHDRVNVNLIYDVASKDDRKERTAAVEKALDEIRNNLDTPDNLSLTAKQIRNSILASGIHLDAKKIRKLRDNIHTQLGIKERFRQGVIRSGRYIDEFRDILKKQEVPVEIALLPLVESSFENRARSSAGAAGIWQFTRRTGRLYLRIRGRVDERLDPAKATRAAARLLTSNYKALGSWPLAITAYNHGRAGMLRAQGAHGSDITKIIQEYESPAFGYASMNFYSEFMAAVDVYSQYEKYFGELVLEKPPTRPTVTAKRVARVATAATTSGKYKVQKGDTLWDIAQHFGVNIRHLMEINGLRNSVIYAGQVLLVN